MQQLPPTEKILSLSSFVSLGFISMKAALYQHAPHIIPVPTALFSAPTNIPGARSFQYDFGDMLFSVLEILEKRESQIIFHIGYIASPQQASSILKAIAFFPHTIECIVADPVMADNGKWYVDSQLLESWLKIIPFARYVTPNLTEAKLIAGFSPDESVPFNDIKNKLKSSFPNVKWVITGIEQKGKIGVKYVSLQTRTHLFQKQSIPASGTGDVFCMHFMINKFVHQFKTTKSIKEAHHQTIKLYKNWAEQQPLSSNK
jgi:pyridoxal/pyridoxine/pyridoxamine kinase